MNLRSLLLTLTVLAAAGGTGMAGLAPSPADAATAEVEVRPADLPRGPEVLGPHLVGTTLVDGGVRIALDDSARLLGASGPAYLVAQEGDDGVSELRRYAADGSHTVLLTGEPAYAARLSDDGAQVVTTRYPVPRRTRVTVRSAVDGRVLSSFRLRGWVDVLDADSGRLLLGGWSPARTFVRDVATGAQRVVAHTTGHAGDLSADRLATFTGDPYEGGCTLVTRISTGARLWRSCREAVWEFAEGGGRMVTIHILSDGPGPGTVWVRGVRGRLLGRYGTAWAFGSVRFEGRALVAEAQGRRWTAWVRCAGSACERASDLYRTEL